MTFSALLYVAAVVCFAFLCAGVALVGGVPLLYLGLALFAAGHVFP